MHTVCILALEYVFIFYLLLIRLVVVDDMNTICLLESFRYWLLYSRQDHYFKTKQTDLDLL